MGNIDLGKHHLRTDLIIENNEVIHQKETIDGFEVTSSYQDGNYITISFEEITNYESREKVGKVLEKLGIDEVVFPEEYVGELTARKILDDTYGSSDEE